LLALSIHGIEPDVKYQMKRSARTGQSIRAARVSRRMRGKVPYGVTELDPIFRIPRSGRFKLSLDRAKGHLKSPCCRA
jgi:hypothetical protein